jgi:6,7-dimethyl-8-ribityllumazine synthase
MPPRAPAAAHGNKGEEAALVAIEMANLREKLA